jgi:hypothetical protein
VRVGDAATQNLELALIFAKDSGELVGVTAAIIMRENTKRTRVDI